MVLDKGEWRQVLVTSAATFGGVTVGLALAFTGSAISQLEGAPLRMPKSQTVFIVAVMPLAAMLAGPIAGVCYDRNGRCSTLVFASIPPIAGYCIMYFNDNPILLIIGRLIIGFGVGSATVAGPLYVGEFANPKVRSFMGVIFQVQIMVGLFLSLLIGTYVNWQVLALISGAFALAWLLLLSFSCESPAYLIDTKREEKARKNLIWLRDSTDIETEMSHLKAESEKRQNHTPKWSDMLTPRNSRGFGMSLLCMSMQQLCGINAIMFYTTQIFALLNTRIEPHSWSIIISAVQVLAMLPVIEAVLWFGRRTMLIGSAITIGCSMLGIACFYGIHEYGIDVSDVSWIPLAAFIGVVIGFSFGLGPVPYIIMAEVLSDEIRGIGSGLSVTSLYLCTFLVTLTFEPLKALITVAGVFTMYAVFCFIGAIGMHFALIETHGKTLGEIQLELGEKRRPSDAPIGTTLYPTQTRVEVFPGRPDSQPNSEQSASSSSSAAKAVGPHENPTRRPESRGTNDKSDSTSVPA